MYCGIVMVMVMRMIRIQAGGRMVVVVNMVTVVRVVMGISALTVTQSVMRMVMRMRRRGWGSKRAGWR